MTVCARCGSPLGHGPLGTWLDRAGQTHCPERKLTADDRVATDDDGQPVVVPSGRHEPAR